MSTTSLVRSGSGTSTALAAPGTQQKVAAPSTVSTNSATSARSTSTQQTQSTTVKPATPQQQPASAPSTPGRWQHPRMDEIIRRQNRAKFDVGNQRTLRYSVGLLALSFIAFPILNWFIPISRLLTSHSYTTYTLVTLRAFLLLNIALACAPLLRKPDTCEDIPLTPSQRQLLGLPPMSRPATPQEKEQWVTPPRYSRSNNNTPSSRGSNNSIHNIDGRGSPLSGVPSAWRSPSGSPSTLGAGGAGGLQVRHGSSSGGRKLSYNSSRSSPLSISDFDALGGSVNTPTKREPGLRASVGLNSKWLYEKGKGGYVR